MTSKFTVVSFAWFINLGFHCVQRMLLQSPLTALAERVVGEEGGCNFKSCRGGPVRCSNSSLPASNILLPRKFLGTVLIEILRCQLLDVFCL
jgi:hypothetical protein